MLDFDYIMNNNDCTAYKYIQCESEPEEITDNATSKVDDSKSNKEKLKLIENLQILCSILFKYV